jgi:hypothetical protein
MTSIRSIIKNLFQSEDAVMIVSGLPRSGTSMMMSALEAGGLPILTDGLRKADPSNPKGYYEYEPVKKLSEGQTEWLRSAQGKAVKVISALLHYLPDDFYYRVIFMERDIDEILASQKRMLARADKIEEKPLSDTQLRQEYAKHLVAVKKWLNTQNWIEALMISYNQILRDPVAAFKMVDAFLALNLDIDAMAQTIDPKLYREQN